MMHVQSCCFANLNLLLFWRSRCHCRRRRRILRSPLSFHQGVKRFPKEWTCRHSTKRCSRVFFDSHTSVTVSNCVLETFVVSVQEVMVYIKSKHTKLYVFCNFEWNNVQRRNFLIFKSSIKRTNFWWRFLERLRYIKRVLAGKWGGKISNGWTDSCSVTTKSFSLSRLKAFLQCFEVALHKPI